MSSYTLYGNQIDGDDKPLGLTFKKHTGKLNEISEKWAETGLAADMTIDKAIIESKDYQGGKVISIDLGYVPFARFLRQMAENVKGDPEKSITLVTKSTGGGMKYKRKIRKTRKRKKSKKNKSKKKKSKRNKK